MSQKNKRNQQHSALESRRRTQFYIPKQKIASELRKPKKLNISERKNNTNIVLERLGASQMGPAWVQEGICWFGGIRLRGET